MKFLARHWRLLNVRYIFATKSFYIIYNALNVYRIITTKLIHNWENFIKFLELIKVNLWSIVFNKNIPLC